MFFWFVFQTFCVKVNSFFICSLIWLKFFVNCQSLESLTLYTPKISKWSNPLKQFVVKFPTNCLIAFDHFVGLALKGLKDKVLISDAQKVLACTSVCFYHREACLESCNCFFTLIYCLYVCFCATRCGGFNRCGYK